MGSSLLRFWVKICLFLVSYFPLFIIIGILHYDNLAILPIVVIASIVGFAGLFITFYVLNRISGEYKKSTTVKPATKINFQYFLAYIIPFIAIDIDSTRQLLAYSVLFVFLGILYIRTELIYVNPTLTMLKYNLFKMKINNEDVMLITKNSYDEVLNDPVIRLGSDLYFERRSK